MTERVHFTIIVKIVTEFLDVYFVLGILLRVLGLVCHFNLQINL